LALPLLSYLNTGWSSDSYFSFSENACWAVYATPLRLVLGLESYFDLVGAPPIDLRIPQRIPPDFRIGDDTCHFSIDEIVGVLASLHFLQHVR
jgi:hypothetical protein